MPYDLSKLLVIGVSSRALFNLELEHEIYEKQRLPAFIDYQRAHESETLKPGTAFPIVKGLLGLNGGQPQRQVEVILMSRNHPDVCLRVFNSIDHHGLDITRAALTGGAKLGPYLKAFKVGLFLSLSQEDVQWAANEGCAAGLIYSAPADLQAPIDQIRIAFDGDCVIFSDEAQKIYDAENLDAFFKHEQENAERELPAGPFANLLRTLSRIQGTEPDRSPVRIALVTARNNPAHKRVILTLRAWNVRIDEAFFLGGIPKAEILKAFGAHMFFDDQQEHCGPAAEKVPTGQVLLPLRDGEKASPEEVEITVRLTPLEAGASVVGGERFLLICKGSLKRDYLTQAPGLEEWYRTTVQGWEEPHLSRFLDELEESVKSTPAGSQRRAVGEFDTPGAKLMSFLERLANKHRPT